jgi:hypothetical protein
MSKITFSDGRTLESNSIKLVTLFDDPERLLVETYTTEPITIFGPHAHEDADLLDQVRDAEKLHYLVHRHHSK